MTRLRALLRRPCFGRRWFHRRQREADALFLMPLLLLKAELTANPFADDVDRDVQDRFHEAIAFHKTMPGAEHWRCACAKAEGRS